MPMINEGQVEANFDSVRGELQSNHEFRELALGQSRLIIQLASKSIKCIHRLDLDGAKTHLGDCKAKLAALRKQMQDSSLGSIAVIHDAEKEAVEAFALLEFVSTQTLVIWNPEEVSVNSYLHGIGEAASELRRTTLDCMRHGDFKLAETYLALMDLVYERLTTFDFPDGLTGGLRRTVDALRAVVERTRSDLTLTLSQFELVCELRKVQK